MPGRRRSCRLICTAAYLQGYLPLETEAVLFKYFDVIAKLGAKEISHAAAVALKAEVIESLAEMELHFPAWELDINRHMVLHLAESVEVRGPPWATAMWAYERFWHRMLRWKSQNNQPEAVMMNTFKAFKTACKVCGTSQIKTFDRPTDEVLMPAYVHAHITGGEVHVELSDPLPAQWLHHKKPKQDMARAEFHMLHLRTHEHYKELWELYVRDLNGNTDNLRLKQMDRLLNGWLAWGVRMQLGASDMALCRGPHPRFFPYDRATINGQRFVSSRLQRTTYRNDVVMLESAGKGVEVGLVKAFISTPAAGTPITADVEGSPDLLELAWVQWFGKSNAAGSTGVVCSQNIRSDNINGNVYRITDLVTTNVALVPRVLRDGNLSTTDWQALKSRPVVLKLDEEKEDDSM